MTHNGIEVDQFILLTIYPAIGIFGIAFLSKRIHIKKHFQYLIQAITCIMFAVIYYFFIPNGGAQGLAIALTLFGLILLLMVRKYKIEPEENDRTSTFKESTL